MSRIFPREPLTKTNLNATPQLLCAHGPLKPRGRVGDWSDVRVKGGKKAAIRSGKSKGKRGRVERINYLKGEHMKSLVESKEARKNPFFSSQ